MPDPVKAAHYIQQLDDARCDENWDAVPELVRKVRKHAPNRSCLTLTAEIEHSIAKANLHTSASLSTDGGAATRPSTAATAPAGLDAATQLPALLAAIDAESRHPQDRFQARVCAGWLLWVLREYTAALARLPHTLLDQDPTTTTPDTNDATDAPSNWTKVSALKSAYLRANCLARDGQRDGALGAFAAALPALDAVWAAGPAAGRPQTRYWAELFLTEYCMLAAQALREGGGGSLSLRSPDCLACFRTWGRYWAAGRGSGQAGGAAAVLPGGYGFRGSVPRRQVWAEYYFALSGVLQGGLPFPTGGLDAAAVGGEGSARSQLRAELKRVETIYQGLLYSETKFPRADEERAEVEDFVRRMMQNWEILNGRGWKEQDLGPGGRDKLCRGTLESLYGAAAKTYHSTAILRHIFTVNLAVAEFDSAFMAFDSWLDLVKKGRARVQKTGHREPALDGDATVYETISACIVALCRFGSREAAEKARKLGEELERMVETQQETERDTDNTDLQDQIPPKAVALAWQSIGLAQAQWARMTYESESRALIQEKAIKCLRKSLSREFGQAVDARGVFALGVLYAEQRKLSASIELVKTTLLAEQAVQEGQELRLGPYWRERSLIPLWHLLALMLSARQEYVMAARACEGAIEQFKDPSVLFGKKHLNGPYRSEHLNEVGARDEKAGDGIVDEMDDYEKESILQIKMTQLAILELVEGPAIAVNASTELLTLFPRLFGDIQQTTQLTKAEPPKTTATTRSIRASVFGSKSEKAARHRQSVANTATTTTTAPTITNEKSTTTPSRPQTTQTTQSATTAGLTQQSSNEGANPDPYAGSSRRSIKSEDLKRRSRNSLRKRDHSGSRARALSTSSSPPVPPLDGDKYSAAFDERSLPHHSAPKQAQQPQQQDGTTAANGSDAAGAAAALASFTPLLPFVHFPQDHTRRRRQAVLVKVWLVIAGFYRRAGLLEDAQQAIAEAEKAARALEADVMERDKKHASGVSVRAVGWGMEKSAVEVLGDVWAEKGHLSVARQQPYQARADFETALTHFPDHPGAIVGLSNILLDIYTEKLLPPPAVPGLDLRGLSLADDDSIFAAAGTSTASATALTTEVDKYPALPTAPLGLGPPTRTTPTPNSRPTAAAAAETTTTTTNGHASSFSSPFPSLPSSSSLSSSPPTGSSLLGPPLPPPHRATSLPLNDRLAARDRAHGLLAGLTKLGRGWNDGEAWLALARAYEESGQAEKARDALWWCVELEDGRGVRGWDVVGGGGGYVL